MSAAPEKAGVGGSTPSLATTFNYLSEILNQSLHINQSRCPQTLVSWAAIFIASP
jgi:hypothetical protein